MSFSLLFVGCALQGMIRPLPGMHEIHMGGSCGYGLGGAALVSLGCGKPSAAGKGRTGAGVPTKVIHAKQRILTMSQASDDSSQESAEDPQQNTPQGFPFDPEQDPPSEEPPIPPQGSPGPPTLPNGEPDEPALEDPQRPPAG